MFLRASTPALLGALLACAPATALYAQAVSPGDDFFTYANAAWLEKASIPAGRDRWGARDEINEVTRQRIAALIDGARGTAHDPLVRKIANFRSAWVNQAAIEARGLAPLRPALDSIARIQDKVALARQLGHSVRADVDPLNWGVFRSSHLIGLAVEESIHGEKNNIPFLVQGGLGLPERESYVGDEPRSQSQRAKYQTYAAGVFALAGFDHAEQRAVAVLALETAIAHAQATPGASANDRNADNLWTRADWARKAPGMDWEAFFTAAGLSGQSAVVAWQPTAMVGVAALVASEPLETWKDYLRLQAINDLVEVLPHVFSEQSAVLAHADSPPDGAQLATQRRMRDVIGVAYADRYFPAAQKARVHAIVGNVTTAFIKRVEGATWMSPPVKALALAKLRTLYVGIGYPEKRPDFSDLDIDSLDAAGNLRRIAEREYRHALKKLGAPVAPSEWWIAPHTANAVLIFQLNAYDFSAALLQPPKFDPTASDAATYGAIGAIIGHDVSHFVDVLGAEYDLDGAMRHWWGADDSVHFHALAQPLVAQFAAYHPFPDVSVNGQLSLTENIADLAGLSAAFDAYRLSLGARVRDSAYVRQHDREFFIAFAQSWRTKLSDAALRTQATSSDHAPETYRVATVRNLDAWYDAFNVRPGARLYLAPAARARIW